MAGIMRWTENEDWAEFYTRKTLVHAGRGRYEAIVNFGGPGAATAYYFYARLEAGSENTVEKVEVEGLVFHETNEPAEVKATPAEFKWVYLGFAKSARSYRRLSITSSKGLSGFERLCVLQVKRRLDTGDVERLIAHERDPEPLSGVPLGGAGAGKLELCRDGFFRNITINGNIDTPIWRSDSSFFALRSESDGRSLARIIGSRSKHGLPCFDIEYEGVYPRAVIKANDIDFPIAVELTASGAVIPHDIKNSSLPLALFKLRLINTSRRRVKASAAFCTENFIGRGGTVGSLEDRTAFDQGYYKCWDESAGNTERPWSKSGYEGILFDGGLKEEKRSEGQYVLAVNGKAGSRLMGWRPDTQRRVWEEFADRGAFPELELEASRGEHTAGAVSIDVMLDPFEAKDIEFVFAWFVPHFWQADGFGDYGRFYSNHLGSAEEVAIYGFENFAALMEGSFEVPRLLLKSSLPGWLSKSLCNDAYVFSTSTWLTKDGRFSVNEGPTHMFGCMGTLDEKLYANHYFTLFFPKLDGIELLGFVRSQGENGGIQHDLGYGHLEQKKRPHDWPDLSSALVLLSLKHYQMTGDEAFIEEAYPCLVRAILEYQLGLDTDDDGIANISGVGSTFDAEKFEGTSAYIASLWLAALKALSSIAKRRGDEEIERQCEEAFEKAKASAIEQLWNGEYFINYRDIKSGSRGENCHFSQIAGEFFAWLCGLSSLYGTHLARQAAASALALNYPPNLRSPTNEATPEGEMPHRFMWGWPFQSRVLLGALPIVLGFRDEGMAVLKRLERVAGKLNGDNRWDQRLFVEPDTGRQHWGRFYMTVPASWYAYQALLGHRWDRPMGLLSIEPNLPSELLPFEGPLFLPSFWALLKVEASGKRMELKVIRTFEQPLAIKALRLPPGSWHAKLDGNSMPLKLSSARDGFLHSCSMNLKEGMSLELEAGA